MAREGPLNFGKPLLYLTVIGCIGGGIYAYFNWPAVYEDIEGNSWWKVNLPHDWVVAPDTDPAHAGYMKANGPLPKYGAEMDKFGVGWIKKVPHGTLIWPDMVVANIPGTPDVVEHDGVNIDYKKALFFEYQDNDTRYMGCAVERGDVLIYVAIGCPKAEFEQNRSLFRKVVESVKCSR